MTNFRLVQTERVSDDNFKFDENGRKLSKQVENTVGKGEIVVTSNFSFSHSVFKSLVSQGRQKVSLCGNGLKNEYYSASKNVLQHTVGSVRLQSSVNRRKKIDLRIRIKVENFNSSFTILVPVGDWCFDGPINNTILVA